MTVDIDELERLAKEATPGPWRHCGASDGRCSCGLVWSIAADLPIAAATDGSDDWSKGRWQDQHYIAAANPQVVFDLVAEVRRLRADLDLSERARATMLRAVAERDALSARIADLETGVDRPALAVAVRELKERRNNYHSAQLRAVIGGAYAEVINSYDATLAEIDGAIAAIERLGGGR